MDFLDSRFLVWIRCIRRTRELRKIKIEMRRSPERDRINQELFRQGIWNRRFGVKEYHV